MTFRVAAPYPAIQTVTFLPSPSMSDVEQQKNQVEERRSINGFYRTYVRSSSSRLFTFSFALTRAKSLELLAFIRSYYRAPWHVIDHDDVPYVVSLVNNPWQFISDRAAEPVVEIVNVQLELEGTQII